jgi:hypothetical protein
VKSALAWKSLGSSSPVPGAKETKPKRSRSVVVRLVTGT